MHCNCVLCLVALFIFFFFNDTATTEIYTLSLHDALPISQLARQLGAGRLARLGREQEAEHRPQTQAQQKRPEPRAPLAHSPASRSSGAATATGRGWACDCSGGLTKRSVIARVPVTRSCSNRNAKFFSRSAAIAPRTSAGRSHMRRLNGPIAFLRLLL